MRPLSFRILCASWFAFVIVAGEGLALIGGELHRTSDVTQVKREFIQFVQRSSVDLFWTFETGDTPKDLTGADQVNFIYATPGGSWTQTIAGSVFNATGGVIKIPFRPTNTDTNSTGGSLFEFNLIVASNTTEVLLDAWGHLDLIRRAGSGATGPFPTSTNVIDLSGMTFINVPWVLSVGNTLTNITDGLGVTSTIENGIATVSVSSAVSTAGHQHAAADITNLPAFLRLDGSTAMSGNLNMGGQSITNVGTNSFIFEGGLTLSVSGDRLRANSTNLMISTDIDSEAKFESLIGVDYAKTGDVSTLADVAFTSSDAVFDATGKRFTNVLSIDVEEVLAGSAFANIGSGVHQFNDGWFSGDVFAGTFTGDGSALSNLPSSAASLPAGYMTGFDYDWTSVSQITIKPGKCRNRDDTEDIVLTTNIIVTFSDLDTGAEGDDELYHLWIGTNGAGENVGKISLDATNCAGITNERLIGHFYNDSSFNILDFISISYGRRLVVYHMPDDYNKYRVLQAGTATAWTTIDVSLYLGRYGDGVAKYYLTYVWDNDSDALDYLDVGPQGYSLSKPMFRVRDGIGKTVGEFRPGGTLFTDADREIEYKLNTGAGSTVTLYISGQDCQR